MRRALLLATAAVAVAPDAFAQEPRPATSPQAGGAGERGTQRSPALDAAFGYPVGGPSDQGDAPPPQGSFDPGFTDQGPARPEDKTYTTPARGVSPDGTV